MALTLAERVFHSTVKLVCFGPDFVSQGTAFFWSIPMPGGADIHYLVTNKHVVEGCNRAVATVHQSDPQGIGSAGRYSDCHLDLVQFPPVLHPEGDVDLCAIPVGHILAEAISKGQPLFFQRFDASCIPAAHQWEAFDAIEEVVMIGCPKGVQDDVNFLPLARRGITATPLKNRYQGRDEFMVDMACFQGASGSPVIMMSPIGFINRQTMQYEAGPRFFFLGILRALPKFEEHGEIVATDRRRVIVPATLHLGAVIRSNAMHALNQAILRHRLAGRLASRAA